jgi:phosphoesterase RecJ-like protein
MIPDPRYILDFIDAYPAFVIAGHKEPDGDCVGSQLALASVLARLGKEVFPVSAGPFKRPEVRAFEASFAAKLPEVRPGLACILLDCSDISRTGELEAGLADYPLAVIDHHASGDQRGQALYIDPESPATTLLVLELMQAMGLQPQPEEARLLLFGLCTDTGFFRHLTETSERAFLAAAALTRAGASPKAVFDLMQGGKSMDSRILLGQVLMRLEAHFGGRLMLSYETFEDSQRFGLEGRDSDAAYQLIQAINGCEAIAIIRQETLDNCTVGLRSKDRINVAEVAVALGGGGHKRAAGLSMPGIIEDVRARVLAEFEKAFAALDTSIL